LLIESAFLASEHFKEVGGTLNCILLDRNGQTQKEKCKDIFDNRAILATEIVKVTRAGYLTRKNAIQLLEQLILNGEPLTSVERDMFNRSKDPTAVHFILRRYKLEEVKQISKVGSSKNALEYLPTIKGAKK